jgi:hypothetical protein
VIELRSNAWRELRLLAAGMLGIGALWPPSPVHPPALCPLRSTTGIPCPLCGMTRSVVAALHGHLMTSLRFNPGGMVVIVLAVALLVRPSVFTALRARLHPSPWLLLPLFAALWIYNVGFNPTFN